MIGSLVKQAVTASAAAAIGGIGVLALQAPAHASTFAASYTCNLPLVGTESVTINGSLTASPNPTTVGAATGFHLHISSLSISSPLSISSWSATAAINVSGAESTSFTVTGSGRSVPANKPITGDLNGTWTPTAAGTDEFQGGNVTIRAKVAFLGNVTVPCTPTGARPVAETLTVT